MIQFFSKHSIKIYSIMISVIGTIVTFMLTAQAYVNIIDNNKSDILENTEKIELCESNMNKIPVIQESIKGLEKTTDETNDYVKTLVKHLINE